MNRQLFSMGFVALMATNVSLAFAFAPLTTRQSPSSSSSSSQMANERFAFLGVPSSTTTKSTTRIWMAAEEEKEEAADAEETDHVAAEAVADNEEKKEEAAVEAVAVVVEAEAEPVDEVTMLKKEIFSAEATLKSKRNTVQYTKDTAEEYSKGGYARKVAEMENMRRVRSSMNSSGRSSAMANVLVEFMPLYDTMNMLKAKYADDEFGCKYTGLTMKMTLSKMGVSEYTVAVGDVIDTYRMTVVDQEYSSQQQKKNTVLNARTMGVELEGNVIRAAEVVASLGEKVDGEEEENVVAVVVEEDVVAAEEETTAASEKEEEKGPEESSKE